MKEMKRKFLRKKKKKEIYVENEEKKKVELLEWIFRDVQKQYLIISLSLSLPLFVYKRKKK